jgi:hypothetical protein
VQLLLMAQELFDVELRELRGSKILYWDLSFVRTIFFPLLTERNFFRKLFSVCTCHAIGQRQKYHLMQGTCMINYLCQA